jgi:hypothetical protein
LGIGVFSPFPAPGKIAERVSRLKVKKIVIGNDAQPFLIWIKGHCFFSVGVTVDLP